MLWTWGLSPPELLLAVGLVLMTWAVRAVRTADRGMAGMRW
jgi:hypothetical protein